MEEDYFVYLPDNRLCAAWGSMAVSTGFTRIPPGSPYPPQRHPDDHHFDWARGRILNAYQIVLISEGRGRLEYGRPGQQVDVGAGAAFLLFPGVWHRFAPEPATGWTEHWIECRGNAFDIARQAGIIDPQHPLRAVGPEIEAVFTAIHQLARNDALSQQAVLSTLGLQLLALLSQQPEASIPPQERLVDRARLLLMERCLETGSIEEVAAELGVSYAYFRRLFRDHAGLSAKQYQMDVRLRRAQDLLLNTDKSIKEIAGLLGFHSAFHLSSQFRRMTGRSPSEYRRDAGAEPGA
jgi:AraC-like DNA-binding protein